MPQGAASHAVPPRTPRTRPRWKRANFWLGKLIPLLLLIFAVKGYSLVIREVVPLVYRHRPLAGLVYFAWVHLALTLTAYSYLVVYFASQEPPEDKEPLPAVQEKRVVFACKEDGSPRRCHRGQCGGAYLSIRSRHCNDCGTCRPFFDHHCSFMDNCVFGATLKPFFCFLVYAALLLLVALVPFAPLQYRACREVIQQTWHTEFMYERWWNRWFSWAGGPVWRYAGALFLGYRHYLHLAPNRPLLIPDTITRTFRRGPVTYAHDVPLYPSFAIPRLSTLAVVVFALLITSIALAMIVVIVRNARSGVSAVQLERLRIWAFQRDEPNPTYDARIRLWVPLAPSESEDGGAVVLVEPDVPLFDLGPGENWRRLMGEKWWHWVLPWVPRAARYRRRALASSAFGGGMDAANLLKPAMARGKIRVIAATTLSEFRKYIEKDAAFERRMQQVLVNEPPLSIPPFVLARTLSTAARARAARHAQVSERSSDFAPFFPSPFSFLILYRSLPSL
ncbi:hypothetical protein JCM8097_005202 [Rhodosporidiobolus ruineniae]